CCGGRFRDALALLEQAGAIFRERCRGATKDLDTADLFWLRTLIFTGDFADLVSRAGPLRREAQERGDLYAAIMNGTYTEACALVAVDDPAGARRLVQELAGQWPQKEFNIQQLHALWGETCIDLYCGEGAAAWSRLNRFWALTKDPQHVQAIRIW